MTAYSNSPPKKPSKARFPEPAPPGDTLVDIVEFSSRPLPPGLAGADGNRGFLDRR